MGRPAWADESDPYRSGLWTLLREQERLIRAQVDSANLIRARLGMTCLQLRTTSRAPAAAGRFTNPAAAPSSAGPAGAPQDLESHAVRDRDFMPALSWPTQRATGLHLTARHGYASQPRQDGLDQGALVAAHMIAHALGQFAPGQRHTHADEADLA